MGWSCSLEKRHAMFNAVDALHTPESERDALKVATHSVVDFSAVFRRATWPTATFDQMAQTLLAKSTKHAGDHTILFLVDDPDRVPNIRLTALYASRYPTLSDEQCAAAREAGKVVIGGRAWAPGKEPYTADELKELKPSSTPNWTRLLADARGKATAIRLGIMAIQNNCQRVARSERFKVAIQWKHGELWTFPNRGIAAEDWPSALVDGMTSHTYGEADHKVTEAVKAIGRCAWDAPPAIVIWTGDTDMYIQVKASSTDPNWPPGTTIVMNKEVVDVDRWLTFGSPGTTGAFECLLMGGADYQKGITQFGYTINDIMNTICEPADTLYICIDEAGALTIDINAALARLQSIPRRSQKRKTIEVINTELNLAAYTTALFAGVSRNARERGGPQIPAIDWFSVTPTAAPYDDPWTSLVQVHCASAALISRGSCVVRIE
jgi:hypothetical protein